MAPCAGLRDVIMSPRLACSVVQGYGTTTHPGEFAPVSRSGGGRRARRIQRLKLRDDVQIHVSNSWLTSLACGPNISDLRPQQLLPRIMPSGCGEQEED